LKVDSELPPFNDDPTKDILVLKIRDSVDSMNDFIGAIGGEEMKESEEIQSQVQLENCHITVEAS